VCAGPGPCSRGWSRHDRDHASGSAPQRVRLRLGLSSRLNRIGITALLDSEWRVAVDILSRYSSPLFMPSPAATLSPARELIEDGTLIRAVLASSARIASGWGLGVAVGIPLGIVMGRFVRSDSFSIPKSSSFAYPADRLRHARRDSGSGPGESAKIALDLLHHGLHRHAQHHRGRAGGQSAASAGRCKPRCRPPADADHRDPAVDCTVSWSPAPGSRWAIRFLRWFRRKSCRPTTSLGALIWTARNFARTNGCFVGILALGMLGMSSIARFGSRWRCCCAPLSADDLMHEPSPTRTFE